VLQILNELIEKLPKLTAVESKMVLYDVYETRHGIFNHHGASKSRPLASVAFHNSENFTEQSVLQDAIEEYAFENYREVWGLSLSEFLALPHYQVKMLRDTMPRIAERKRKALAEAEEAVNQTIKP
jgi:phosphoserine aminotransferase